VLVGRRIRARPVDKIRPRVARKACLLRKVIKIRNVWKQERVHVLGDEMVLPAETAEEEVATRLAVQKVEDARATVAAVLWLAEELSNPAVIASELIVHGGTIWV